MAKNLRARTLERCHVMANRHAHDGLNLHPPLIDKHSALAFGTVDIYDIYGIYGTSAPCLAGCKSCEREFALCPDRSLCP